MKKILLISYGDYDFDGRLRELTKIFDSIGEVFSFSKGLIIGCGCSKIILLPKFAGDRRKGK